jgi:hypothetical protein
MAHAAQLSSPDVHAPSFRTAFVGFVSSVTLMTIGLVLLGSL